MLKATREATAVNTDERNAYDHLPQAHRIHVSVCHTPGKRVWAGDQDGDGIREVHNKTLEGLWTGLRNFLLPFLGVNKAYVQQYLAMHEWAHNLKTIKVQFLRRLCRVTHFAT